MRRKTPLTPEKVRARNLQIARGTLIGVPVFDQMKEAMQASLIADTTELVAYIARKHGGHYRSGSSDVSWSALNQAYFRNPGQESAFSRFRQALTPSSHEVYRILYAMLEEGVTTREALARKSSPPPDLLEGMNTQWHPDDK